MDITSTDFTFKATDGTDVIAYMSRPQSGGPHPGILVMHEVFGLTDQIKGVVRRFAEQGYVAVAPHLFSRQKDLLTQENIERAFRPLFSLSHDKRDDPAEIAKLMKGMAETDRKVMEFFFSGPITIEHRSGRPMLGIDRLYDDALRCKDYMLESSYIDRERLGIAGFCLGGSMTYRLSTMYPFKASVPFYGANPEPIDSVAKIAGPVFGIYGGEDVSYCWGIPAIVESMIKHKKTFQMKVYEGARHSFFNELSVRSYNKAASEDAWIMVLAFFDKYLRQK